MSGDMPKVWWSPSDGGWFAKDPLGAFCALGSSYDVEGLPEDAVELLPVSAAPAAPIEPRLTDDV